MLSENKLKRRDFMRKKLIIGLALLMVAAVSIGGTVAYFSKSFASDDNKASAAKFNVDVVNADGGNN